METVPAHPLSTIVLFGGSLVVPLLAFATYYWSGATLRKSIGIAVGVAVWGVAVVLFARDWQFHLGSQSTVWIFIAANFVLPSVLVVVFRQFFVGNGLSLAWLTVPHAFRYMGGLFILENFLGHTGTAFAFTAGFGDIIAAVIATTLLLQILAGDRPGSFIFYVLIIFGTVDFLVAYSLSFLSTEGVGVPLLTSGGAHYMGLLPLALLPFYLVPFAMAYHAMMFLTLRAKSKQPELSARAE